ncbi:hypothetical protein L6452_42876 [Arctium lappa]|uniref:Uncharacterized protein n=1 Tax=Arctium lappa TaxID=4217 RepID=A0ACB8XK31_ARCLA|nr:hypothetical protein L6452_42876 [Arctium lappa]
MEGVNKNIVCDFYKSLAVRDTVTVQRLLAPDIDWWFHGPPAHKFNLMQILTGGCVCDDNNYFEPISIVAIGSIVVAEGYHIHESEKTHWVHAWTVENGKIITEVKEYLNTSVTVACFKMSNSICITSPRSPKFKNMWHSELTHNASIPRLLLVL